MPVVPEKMYLKNRIVDLCKDLVETDVEERDIPDAWHEEMMSLLNRLTCVQRNERMNKILKPFMGD
jgi:Zn-dependent M32 family carboxypeptidase